MSKYKYFECVVEFYMCPDDRENLIVCTDPQWLGHTWDNPNDNAIFYYADGYDELFNLMERDVNRGWRIVSIIDPIAIEEL